MDCTSESMCRVIERKCRTDFGSKRIENSSNRPSTNKVYFDRLRDPCTNPMFHEDCRCDRLNMVQMEWFVPELPKSNFASHPNILVD